jgi:hypothetical protein
MASDVLLTRKGGRFVPADVVSAEAIDGIREGETVRAVITRPRNVGHHRKFFALLQVVFDAQDRFPTVEALLDAIKIATGLYDTYKLNGREVMKLRSISFASMDQKEFTAFYDRVLHLIVTHILPHTDKADLEQRVYDIVDGRKEAA